VRIERVEIIPYALRFSAPYVTARGQLERRELLLLRLRAGGVEGLGEAAPLLLRGGASLAEIAGELDQDCRPLLEGARVETEQLVSECAERGVSPQTLAAVELGLLDLAGKLSGRPVWRLLGAEHAQPVACNATLVAAQPAAVAAAARRWAKRGFGTFKLKLGLDGDLDQVKAVREALGADARIRIDANGAWTAERAIATLTELEPQGIELAEQPVATLAEMATVRAEVATPLAADESVSNAAEARAAVSARACDAATVKIAKVGGISAARAVIEEIPVYLSSALDGPIGIAAAAHLAQVMPHDGFAAELAHGLATAELFADSIASSGLDVIDAAITPSSAPGWGVEIDEQALRQRALQPGGRQP
jgi:o-succinylbenzoate synthase